MAATSATSLGKAWRPGAANFTEVSGEVLLSVEEYALFLKTLPPGWRLVDVQGFDEDSGSEDVEGSSCAVGSSGRGGVGRGRGRGRSSSSVGADAEVATGLRRSTRQIAESARYRSDEEEQDSLAQVPRKRRRPASELSGGKTPLAAVAGTTDEQVLRQRIEQGVEQLSQEQVDRVIEFLKEDLTDENGDGTDFALDVDALPLTRRQALLEFIEMELQGGKAVRSGITEVGKYVDETSAGGSAPAPVIMGNLLSPSFPAVDPGDSPLPGCLVNQEEAAVAGRQRTPHSIPGVNNAVAAASEMKRSSHAWEVCSAREMQKHHHMREVEERASGGTPAVTPKGERPAAVEEPPEAPLPPLVRPIGQGDSMLDNCEEVLSMLEDFNWM